jgi:hypothetical protein
MQEMAVSTKINGVDVDRLFETIDAIKQIPRLADFKFCLSNRWINGGAEPLNDQKLLRSRKRQPAPGTFCSRCR